MSETKILAGIRVVEVSDYVFAPVAGAVLAQAGAEVIKVEHHERGDAMRGGRVHEPTRAQPDRVNTVAFVLANRGKRSIGLNLATEGGRAVLYDLVKNADVFITNRTRPTLDKLSIGLEAIRAHNPGIIYAHATPHGSKGPEADRGGYDTSDFWYRSGIAAALHAPTLDQPPSMPTTGFGDITSGYNLAAGITSALLHRERTGEALTVEGSLLSSALWAMSVAVGVSSLAGKPIARTIMGLRPNPLYGVYGTRDGRFVNMCTVQGQRHAAEFCRLLGLDAAAQDERYVSAATFDENAPALRELIVDAIAAMTSAEFAERMASYSGQWAPVQDALTVSSDAQALANGYVQRSSDPEDAMTYVAPPVQVGRPPSEPRPVPDFNEHGDEILKELGRTEAEVDALRLAGAIA